MRRILKHYHRANLHTLSASQQDAKRIRGPAPLRRGAKTGTRKPTAFIRMACAHTERAGSAAEGQTPPGGVGVGPWPGWAAQRPLIAPPGASALEAWARACAPLRLLHSYTRVRAIQIVLLSIAASVLQGHVTDMCVMFLVITIEIVVLLVISIIPVLISHRRTILPTTIAIGRRTDTVMMLLFFMSAWITCSALLCVLWLGSVLLFWRCRLPYSEYVYSFPGRLAIIITKTST